MIYIKDTDSRYKTLKELAAKYQLPLTTLKGRYFKGLRSIEELTVPKQTGEK